MRLRWLYSVPITVLWTGAPAPDHISLCLATNGTLYASPYVGGGDCEISAINKTDGGASGGIIPFTGIIQNTALIRIDDTHIIFGNESGIAARFSALDLSFVDGFQASPGVDMYGGDYSGTTLRTIASAENTLLTYSPPIYDVGISTRTPNASVVLPWCTVPDEIRNFRHLSNGNLLGARRRHTLGDTAGELVEFTTGGALVRRYVFPGLLAAANGTSGGLYGLAVDEANARVYAADEMSMALHAFRILPDQAEDAPPMSMFRRRVR